MSYSSIVFWVLLSLTAICYAVFYLSRRRLYELASLIPGIPGLPLLGNTLQFSGTTVDITRLISKLTDFGRKNGGIMKAWLGPFLYIGIGNPADVELVLSRELSKCPEYRFLKPWMAGGLVCGDLPIWKVRRKRLTPTFHQNILDGFMECFIEKSDILAKKIANLEGNFDANSYIAPCTLDIICATAMGVEVNAQENSDIPYLKATIAISQLMYKRMFQIWLHPEWIFKLTNQSKRQAECLEIIRSFSSKIVKLKRQEAKNRSKEKKESDIDGCTYMDDDIKLNRRNTFLDMLMDTQWTDQELQDEVDTMTAAGYDVTTHATSLILMVLGSHQHIQDKLYDEVYGIYSDSDRSISKEDLAEMPYLDRVIKEALRLFPTVPVIVRRMKNEVTIEKYTLPADVDCIINIYGMHRDPATWGENADEFDPDNFLPERCATRHPSAYLPFSTGPRNCLGKQYALMSMKVMIVSILRKSKILCDVNLKTMEMAFEILLKPVGGYMISIEPRSSCASKI